MRTVTEMLRKGSEVRWSPVAKGSFEDTKNALTKAAVLISPNFDKQFSIYSFASEHTISGVLLQKNEEGHEQPIAFFSKTLRDAPFKYNILQNQAFALIKTLKDFRVYIIHSHSVAYVPSAVVNDILTQLDPEGRRAKWIAILLKYDLEIKYTKVIKGQGLSKLMTQEGIEEADMNFLDLCELSDQIQQGSDISWDFLASPWYRDIIYVIKNLQAPPELTGAKVRSVKIRSLRYCILNGYLYWKDKESSNKSLIRTIKKLLQENKKAWNTKLVFALWANRLSTKKSIGTSHFQLVYGVDVIFPASLAMSVMKYV